MTILETPWWAPITFYNDIGGQVNSFDPRGHKNPKLSSFTFQNNFLHYRARGMRLPPSCFSRQDALKHMHGDLERSIKKFHLGSRSRGNPSWVKWVMMHITRCVLTRRAQWDLSHIYISSQSKVVDKKYVCDLWWPQMTFMCHGSILTLCSVRPKGQ